MPIYCYRCKCGHSCEILKPFTDSLDDSHICEQCQREMVRVMGGVSVHYKGNGFFSTDYKEDE